MRPFLKLLRASHWIKNSFLFLPAFFAGALLQIETLVTVVLGFLSFSMVASAVYIFNDYCDLESDRLHHEKSQRPLAAGIFSKSFAVKTCIALLVVGLFLSAYLDLNFLFLMVTYFLMNVLYSIKLKQIPVLDVTIVALGFFLRIAAGGILAEVYISKWIIMMTFLLALFLALSKRRDDVLILTTTGERVRKSIDGYNLQFIDASMMVMGAVVIVSYIMYTASEEVIERIGNDNLYLTTIFVLLGILRYMQISVVESRSASPTRILLKDRFIQITIACWLASFYLLLYS